MCQSPHCVTDVTAVLAPGQSARSQVTGAVDVSVYTRKNPSSTPNESLLPSRSAAMNSMRIRTFVSLPTVGALKLNPPALAYPVSLLSDETSGSVIFFTPVLYPL